jgi:hypothetical protein
VKVGEKEAANLATGTARGKKRKGIYVTASLAAADRGDVLAQ